MSWIYEQLTGRLRNAQGDVIGVGYSGRSPDGKNQPSTQNVPDVGPIPCGDYTMQPPVDTVTHGPYVLALTPDPTNEMFGRSGFLMHGDSVVNPGTASLGCIIQSRDVRETVWNSGDRFLTVVSGEQGDDQ
jgi:hypothetical protein